MQISGLKETNKEHWWQSHTWKISPSENKLIGHQPHLTTRRQWFSYFEVGTVVNKRVQAVETRGTWIFYIEWAIPELMKFRYAIRDWVLLLLNSYNAETIRNWLRAITFCHTMHAADSYIVDGFFTFCTIWSWHACTPSNCYPIWSRCNSGVGGIRNGSYRGRSRENTVFFGPKNLSMIK